MELPVTSQDLHNSPIRPLSEWSIAAWLAAAFITFSLAWAYTNGGYECSFPLLILLTLYCYSSKVFKLSIFKELLTSVKVNAVYLFWWEKRSVALILMYWLFKLQVITWCPKWERSNGSPVSLIFFTILFIILYIIPTVIYRVVVYFVTFLRGKHSSHPDVLLPRYQWLSASTREWRRTVLIMLCLVMLLYIFDGDITSILRYIGKGKPCWPVLIPPSVQIRKELPYPLQHAWIKTWHHTFAGYHPSSLTMFVISLGREMGEVCRLLPVLIGVYIFVQIFVPQQYCHIKHTFFSCVAGVVLGGVTSGSFKILFHRYRPNAYGNPYMWKGPGSAVVNHLLFSKLDLSFPAGHTTVTSAVATCLFQAVCIKVPHMSKGLKLWLGVCTYSYPLVVLLSRVSDCYHWTSDAVFGIFLGYVVGNLIMSRLIRSQSAQSNAVLPNGQITHL